METLHLFTFVGNGAIPWECTFAQCCWKWLQVGQSQWIRRGQRQLQWGWLVARESVIVGLYGSRIAVGGRSTVVAESFLAQSNVAGELQLHGVYLVGSKQ